MANMKFSALSVVLLVSSSWMSSGVIVRHYNEINRKEVATLEEFQDQFMSNHVGSEDVLVTSANILLGVSEPQVNRQAVIFCCIPSPAPVAILFLMFAAFRLPVSR
jgi:hypothetical protein